MGQQKLLISVTSYGIRALRQMDEDEPHEIGNDEKRWKR